MNTSAIAQKAKNYKLRISSRYLSVDVDRINERIAKQDQYHVSTKHDGHFYTYCYQDGKGAFINPKGRVIEDLNLNETAEKHLKSKGIKQAVFAGELYLYAGEGTRTRSFNLTKALTDKDHNLRFAAFDLIELEEEDYVFQPVHTTIEKLRNILPTDGDFHLVDYQTVSDRKTIAELYKKSVEVNDQEGIVVKTEGITYKVKPKYTFDAVIVGYADSDGDRKGMFRDLLLAMMHSDGTYQIIGHLHHGFNDEARKQLSSEMQKDIVKSEYIEVARNKTAFHLIKPTRVIEFSCLDVIAEDSKGPISKMALNYSDEDGYTLSGKKNSVSFTIPNFLQFRTDKEANILDTRFDQVKEVVSFHDIDTVDEGELPPSEIIRREAYTKESKGSLMVRKYVILKTHKESTGKYPAYVVLAIDYSAGRKDPLKQDAFLTNSETQAAEIFEKQIDKGVKKGWELHQ